MGKNVATNILHLIKRFKYQITIILGVLLVGFFDEDSIMKYIELEYQISDLKKEIVKYENKYQNDSEEMKRLQKDPKEYGANSPQALLHEEGQRGYLRPFDRRAGF